MPQPIPEQEHEAVEPVGVEAVLPLQEAGGHRDPHGLEAGLDARVLDLGLLVHEEVALQEAGAPPGHLERVLGEPGAAVQGRRGTRDPHLPLPGRLQHRLGSAPVRQGAAVQVVVDQEAEHDHGVAVGEPIDQVEREQQRLVGAVPPHAVVEELVGRAEGALLQEVLVAAVRRPRAGGEGVPHQQDRPLVPETGLVHVLARLGVEAAAGPAQDGVGVVRRAQLVVPVEAGPEHPEARVVAGEVELRAPQAGPLGGPVRDEQDEADQALQAQRADREHRQEAEEGAQAGSGHRQGVILGPSLSRLDLRSDRSDRRPAASRSGQERAVGSRFETPFTRAWLSLGEPRIMAQGAPSRRPHSSPGRHLVDRVAGPRTGEILPSTSASTLPSAR